MYKQPEDLQHCLTKEDSVHNYFTWIQSGLFWKAEQDLDIPRSFLHDITQNILHMFL